MKKIIPLVLLSTFLFGCAGVGAKKQADPVLLSNAEVIAGKRQLLLGDFRVSFITFDKSSAKAESSMFSSDSGYARSTLRAKLAGVPDSVMQELTDAAYQDFVSKLKANGYSLADGSVLAANGEWQKLDMEASPKKITSSFKAITGGNQESSTFAPSGKSLIKMSIAKMLPYQVYSAANEVGMPILNVNYTVHFVYFGRETDYKANAYTDFKGAEYSAEVSAGQGIQVVPGSGLDLIMGVTSTFNDPNAKLSIGAPVVVPGPFGRSNDATSGFQKAANTFSAVMGMVSGGASSAKDIDITADPDVYAANAKKALLEANQRLTSALAAAK